MFRKRVEELRICWNVHAPSTTCGPFLEWHGIKRVRSAYRRLASDARKSPE
jgi:hypothetical protein